MIFRSKLADFFFRMAVGLAIGLFFGWVLSETSFSLLDEKQTVDRPPEQVTIVIPYGTAAQVDEGVYNRSIPTDMVFVQGDVLVVKNEDTVPHTLGPLWIPPKTSAAMSLDMADKFSYECSFQPTSYMGLDVRPTVEGGVRSQAILAVGLPTGMMLGVYSYLIPIRKKKEAAAV